MQRRLNARAQALLLASALAASAHLSFPQSAPQQPQPAHDEEVVRISSDIVQTDVLVFDKSGKFVEGLKPEQFELKVEGRPQPVSFLDTVRAGAFDEEAQLAAARGRPRGGAVLPLDRGRQFILFLDDLHVAPADLQAARDAMLRFVDEEMGQNDEAAVFTSSGQLGFLQQMTGDKEVLRLAIRRVVSRFFDTRDADRTPMTEAQALAIDHNDRGVFDYFVDQMLKEMNMTAARTRGAGRGRSNSGGGGMVGQAETTVKARARNIVMQANAVTKNTLTSLENVLRTSSALPGQKVLFFISGGFFIDTSAPETSGFARRIANAAAHSGTLIYTLDAHGLGTGHVTPGAATPAAFDPNNQLHAANSSALSLYQEPFYALASETGGRALLDTNDLRAGLRGAVQESSRYYLLAWKPEPGAAHTKYRQVEVRVKDRPDLIVRFRRGYSDEPPAADSEKDRKKKEKEKAKNPEAAELLAALRSLYPRRALPTSVAAGYTDSPSGDAQLTVSIEVEAEALGFKADGTGEPAALDIAGAVVDDAGKAVSEFDQSLTVSPVQTARGRRRVIYNQQLQLKPGLYQVRAAARDRRTGRAGSSMQWLEVPDVKKGGLTLSSLFVGEADDGSSQLAVCADRRFARDSRLGFFLYVYNAARASAKPDVALQVQIFRDDQPVVTKPLVKLPTDGATDLARLPYGEDLSLGELPPGRYVLQITAIDRAAKTSATRRAGFVVQ